MSASTDLRRASYVEKSSSLGVLFRDARCGSIRDFGPVMLRGPEAELDEPRELRQVVVVDPIEVRREGFSPSVRQHDATP
jgi:hypothetical protein